MTAQDADRAGVERLAKLERLARRMDAVFRIPGTRVRFGWDSVIGLAPVLGDTLTLAPGAYIILSAHRMGAPKTLLARMGVNMGLDWMAGLIPVAGDLFDVAIKSNIRNVALLRAHMEKAARNGLPADHPVDGQARRAPSPRTARPPRQAQPTSSRPEKK